MINEEKIFSFKKSFRDELNKPLHYQNPTLRWILNGVDSHFENKLSALKITWNRKIRNFFRNVLSLSTKNTPIRAVFKLDKHGYFASLIEDQYPDLDFFELTALNRFLRESEFVEPFFFGNHEFDSLLECRSFAENRLKQYNLDEIIQNLFHNFSGGPGSDVFGTYFLSDHHVEIYILPCIIFSILIEEDYLDVATNTLAHEFAHGIQHVGEDKDGGIWESFGDAQLDLIEGLAESYSREFARSVFLEKPSILSTFEKTAKHLPPCYTRYEEWDRSITLEAVYQAFIEARRRNITTYDEFVSLMKDARARLDPWKNSRRRLGHSMSGISA